MFRFKMAAKKQFLLREISEVTKIQKMTFPKECFLIKFRSNQKIIIMLIYFKYNMKKKVILFKLGGQNKFHDIVQ